MVSLFIGFFGSKLLVFVWFFVSWFLGFKDLTNFPVVFQEEIDPISKIFKILLHGSSGFVGARLFQHRQSFEFPKLRFIKIILFGHVPGMFLFLFRCAGVSKDTNSSF